MIPPYNPTISSSAALIDRCLSLTSLAAVHGRLITLGLHRHTFLANRLLTLYSRLGAVTSAVAAFHDIPNKNTFTYNILITSLFRTGRVEDAHQLFDEMPHRDTVSWNSMITGYMSIGLVDSALLALRQMVELGVKPSSFTFSIAASCIHSQHTAKQIHGYVIRTGLNSTVVANSLIDMYGRVRLTGNAHRVFRVMEELDIISWNSVISVCRDRSLELFHSMRASGFLPDVFTVSTMISVCTENEDLAKGEQLLACCFKMGYLANSIVSSAVIDMYSKCGRLDDSVRLFQGLTRWDSAVCNSMTSGYAGNGLVQEALKLFVVSLRMEIRPTEFTFASILRSSSCFGLTEQGTQIHCLALKVGVVEDMIVSNALVDMYAKLGSVESGKEIFCTMTTKDLICWNTMIMGFAQNGQGIQALRFFREMQERGTIPDRITLIGVLSACSREGMIVEGEKIFASMERDYGVKRGLEHYACMVDLLGRSGRFREAIEVMESMPRMPCASIWKMLLEACVIHGDLRFAEIVSEVLLEVEPRSLLPYIVLIQISERRSRWERMASLIKTMREKCLEKANDYSWICSKNCITLFGSDQILNFGGEATYSSLRLLFWEMENEVYVPDEQYQVFEDG